MSFCKKARHEMHVILLRRNKKKNYTVSIITRALLQASRINILPWPSCSPYLNPIEQILSGIKLLEYAYWYCLYNFIEGRGSKFDDFILAYLEKNSCHINKWNTLTNCYFVLFIDWFEKR